MPNREQPPSQRRVALRLARRTVQLGRWDSERWHVVALTPSALPETREPRLVQRWESTEGEEFLWDGLTLSLHPDQTAHYLHNLTGRQPVLFVVCTPDEECGGMRAVQLTLSQDEAGSHMEVEDEVLALPLPREIKDWVSEYVARIGVRQEPHRRRACND